MFITISSYDIILILYDIELKLFNCCFQIQILPFNRILNEGRLEKMFRNVKRNDLFVTLKMQIISVSIMLICGLILYNYNYFHAIFVSLL